MTWCVIALVGSVLRRGQPHGKMICSLAMYTTARWTRSVFGFGLGYVLFHETITSLRALAALIIISAAFILSFDSSETIRFKKKVVGWMLCASRRVEPLLKTPH